MRSLNVECRGYSGIYKITNNINNKIYVGSAACLYKREIEHFTDPHKSAKLLQKAMLKYGKENFKFEVLELCEKEILYIREQFWLDELKSYINNYNISSIARGSRYPNTKESIKKVLATKKLKGHNKYTYPKLSTSKLGNKNPMYNRKGKDNPTSKIVQSFTLENTFIKEFSCCREASEYFNIPRRSISRVACGDRKQTHNIIFKYK